jgi:hypothetical protein
MSSDDRRTPGTTRTPFEGLVEVGGALGPSFEAQAVNVSEEGMQLRTAYLPEVGQPLSCRFDAGPGQSVLASGEVVWTQPAERGGEFGVRFTDLDAESVDALKRACGVAGHSPEVHAGAKVRLHIEGLASPMRAKIKDAAASAVTVGSELGFLRVGKQLELEDAESGRKRAASIDRVEVAVDPASHVPQLVVTLRYADAEADGTSAAPAEQRPAPAAPPSPEPARAADEFKSALDASSKMKGALAQGIARIGPALEQLARRARTTVGLLSKKRAPQEDAAGPRRTTSPPPGGGLHASGRRVVRGDGGSAVPEPPATMASTQLTKRKAAIASAVMLTAILGAVALKKSHHENPADAAAPAASSSSQPAGAEAMASAAQQPSAAAPVPPPPALPSDPRSGPGASPSLADNGSESGGQQPHKHHHPAPFGNGPVHHANVLHLKMDGPVEAIEGAQQPTGFTVKLPGRKSLEAAGPLAARDARIASIKVSNDPAGAELTVVFKDGVPNYQVSGRGDTLVVALAPAGSLEKTVANKDEKGGKSPKHGKHHKQADGSGKKDDGGGAT